MCPPTQREKEVETGTEEEIETKRKTDRQRGSVMNYWADTTPGQIQYIQTKITEKNNYSNNPARTKPL